MADKLDRIIGDYLTGRLAANIKARELDLRARKPTDNLGIRTQSLGIAPQESEFLRVEEDELNGILGRMKRQKEILDMFWDVECSETKKALLLHYQQRMTWYGVAQEMFVGVTTLWRWNKSFKEMIRPYL
ncbi:DUF722 domain-containing protein [Lactococcus lactis]|uniref:DUF722 domain-containing protein n=1 Tax=Lactococcus lactis TaxID=1358 RepID=UPI002659303C|nr:DUF722 domain-containing protein [Lactococcus lactis]MDT2858185.1 DUF722 domain-containing protein [Lactococcus lactis]WKG34469.1 DUF722 domain-containing protein [Lactococcus lactis subsp. lactis]